MASLPRWSFGRAAGCAASLLAIACLAASSWWRPRPLLLWNASPSSTMGLYVVTSPGRPRLGDTIVAWAPPSARRIAARRAYLPLNVPLVKRVAAIAGDRVCARQSRIFINGRRAALRRRRDLSGRPLPWWSGCVRLSHGEIFLLSSAGPLAFDGRYFGATRRSELVGRAWLLWPNAAGPSRG